MPKDFLTQSSGNTYRDLGFDEITAKKLKIRSQLMNIIAGSIQKEGLTQQQAAERLKISQPRVSNLIHGKLDLFSIDALLDMMERLGFTIYTTLEHDTKKWIPAATQKIRHKHHSIQATG